MLENRGFLSITFGNTQLPFDMANVINIVESNLLYLRFYYREYQNLLLRNRNSRLYFYCNKINYSCQIIPTPQLIS